MGWDEEVVLNLTLVGCRQHRRPRNSVGADAGGSSPHISHPLTHGNQPGAVESHPNKDLQSNLLRTIKDLS